MDEHKVYIIRIKALQNTEEASFNDPEDFDVDSSGYVFEYGASVANNISDTVSDIIGTRGEYVDWVELSTDELFAEEWVIYDDDCIEELQIQNYGLDEVEVIIEESRNTWINDDGEWQIKV